MIPREIVGPQDRFERTGAQALRDVRPITTRLSAGLVSESPGVVLAVAAGAMVSSPPWSISSCRPLSSTRACLDARVKLPMRLPKSEGSRIGIILIRRRGDRAKHPDHLSRPRRDRQGTVDLAGGWRQHATIPGTTGAGKTTAILSFLANALTHASGFVLVDGKADNKLFKEVLALARGSGARMMCCISISWSQAEARTATHSNPFAVETPMRSGNGGDQLGEQAPAMIRTCFPQPGCALIGAVVPVLTGSGSRKHRNRYREDKRCAGTPCNLETGA